MSAMGSLTVRALALFLVVPLALPPGWCCSGPAPTARAAEAPAHEPGGCCGHARHGTKAAPAPCDRPAPSRLGGDCCCRPVVAIPSDPESLRPDLGPAAPLDVPPAPAGPTMAWPGVTVGESPPTPTPLHVLHCRWTC
jgi:hypothetical protein